MSRRGWGSPARSPPAEVVRGRRLLLWDGRHQRLLEAMLAMLLAALLVAAPAQDTLVTKDGSRLTGTIVEESPTDGVTMRLDDGTLRRFDRDAARGSRAAPPARSKRARRRGRARRRRRPVPRRAAGAARHRLPLPRRPCPRARDRGASGRGRDDPAAGRHEAPLRAGADRQDRVRRRLGDGAARISRRVRRRPRRRRRGRARRAAGAGRGLRPSCPCTLRSAWAASASVARWGTASGPGTSSRAARPLPRGGARITLPSDWASTSTSASATRATRAGPARRGARCMSSTVKFGLLLRHTWGATAPVEVARGGDRIRRGERHDGRGRRP